MSLASLATETLYGTPPPSAETVPHESWVYGGVALLIFMLMLLVVTRFDLDR